MADQANKKKFIIYGVIILVIGAANVFIYMRNSGSDISDSAGGNLVNQQLLDEQASGIAQKKQVDILEHNLFKSLEKIGDWPVEPGAADFGKANPFAPTPVTPKTTPNPPQNLDSTN